MTKNGKRADRNTHLAEMLSVRIIDLKNLITHVEIPFRDIRCIFSQRDLDRKVRCIAPSTWRSF